jgi:phosphate-selective porin OprO/OprP
LARKGTLTVLACLVLCIAPISSMAVSLVIYHYFDDKKKPLSIKWANENNVFSVETNGYFQSDFVGISQSGTASPGFANLRAARLDLVFSLYSKWQGYVSYNVANNLLRDVNISYGGNDAYLITAGVISPMFGLSNNTNTDALTFLELSLPVNLFSPGYYSGGVLIFLQDPFVFSASFYGPSIQSESTGRSPLSSTVSVSYAPIHHKTKALFFTTSAWWQQVDGGKVEDFSTPPEIDVPDRINLGFLDTGSIANSNYYTVVDFAAGAVYGPWEAQAEYLPVWVTRYGAPTLVFGGYYASINYFLTGESRKYVFKSTSFIGITPIRHSYGAWQIALRYSHLNLNSKDVCGGQEADITVGLNWYPVRSVEFLFNYIRAMADPSSSGQDQSANIYAFRMMYYF